MEKYQVEFLLGSGKRVKGEGEGWVTTEKVKPFVFRQILVSFAQLSNPLSPSTVREKNGRS